MAGIMGNHGEIIRFRRTQLNQKLEFPWFLVLALALLIISGIFYRVLSNHFREFVDKPIILPVPLKEFPKEVGPWKGEDVPISQTILKVAGNDDYLSRLYINKSNNQWVNVYVAFTARPRTMLGHRPQVCYPASGWIHLGSEEISIKSKSGAIIPCLLHRFRRPAPRHEEILVLNYYILNGRLTINEKTFDSIGYRTPNIEGDIARYVTQVQISSTMEASARNAIHWFVDLLMDYFPDQSGIIKAAEDKDAIGDLTR